MTDQRCYLLTGRPRVGKSTVIKRVVERVGRERCGGFYTEEIRENGERKGFRLVTLDGRSGLLAHEQLASPFRIGRYSVDVTCMDALGVPAIANTVTRQRLLIIDELGPMEASSASFRQVVSDVLNSTLPFIGTIALASHPWLDTIKQHPRVIVRLMDVHEREAVYDELVAFAQTVLTT